MRWLVLACLVVLPGPGRADPIAGQTDPRFEAALATWLADDEPTALPELADLAAGGNRAAQLLLSLIDVTAPYQGPWLVAQDRKARLALTRAPGGLSGRSWLEAAAADTPLAALWLQRADTAATADTALDLAGIGEGRAARDTLQALAARQYRGFADVADDPRYPPELRHLVWREWAATPEGRARAEAEIAALPPGDPQIQRFTGRHASQPDQDAWLASAPLAGPLRATCQAFCPAVPETCLRAAYILVDGHPALAQFGTPSETLIPPDVWNASPHGRKALLRVPYARHRFGAATAAEVRTADTCLADALAAEVGRYAQ